MYKHPVADDIRVVLMKEQKPYEEGSILMNAPEHETMEELAEIALDKQRWKRGANARMQSSMAALESIPHPARNSITVSK